jgi:hypothetical protein
LQQNEACLYLYWLQQLILPSAVVTAIMHMCDM